MKKTFVNPEMNISLFDMENVVTTSGTETPVVPASTNLKDAQNALNGANGITTIDWTF
jgi:hypothetical protein